MILHLKLYYHQSSTIAKLPRWIQLPLLNYHQSITIAKLRCLKSFFLKRASSTLNSIDSEFLQYCVFPASFLAPSLGRFEVLKLFPGAKSAVRLVLLDSDLTMLRCTSLLKLSRTRLAGCQYDSRAQLSKSNRQAPHNNEHSNYQNKPGLELSPNHHVQQDA